MCGKFQWVLGLGSKENEIFVVKTILVVIMSLRQSIWHQKSIISMKINGGAMNTITCGGGKQYVTGAIAYSWFVL
jgi:hypothetical protein